LQNFIINLNFGRNRKLFSKTGSRTTIGTCKQSVCWSYPGYRIEIHHIENKILGCKYDSSVGTLLIHKMLIKLHSELGRSEAL
jgi:hypothetical protein